MVDAENLLNDHHAALGGSRGVGAIGAQLMAVVGSERELLTQFDLLSNYLAERNAHPLHDFTRRANECNGVI